MNLLKRAFITNLKRPRQSVKIAPAKSAAVVAREAEEKATQEFLKNSNLVQCDHCKIYMEMIRGCNKM
jgi:hypothetical protein